MMKKLTKILIYFLLFVTGLILLNSLGFLLLKHADAITGINSFIKRHSLYFALWRYFLMAVIIYFYPALVRRFYRGKKMIDYPKLHKYSRRRYPLIILVLTELLLAQNWLGLAVNRLIGF
jgi:hypothetical protein